MIEKGRQLNNTARTQDSIQTDLFFGESSNNDIQTLTDVQFSKEIYS